MRDWSYLSTSSVTTVLSETIASDRVSRSPHTPYILSHYLSLLAHTPLHLVKNRPSDSGMCFCFPCIFEIRKKLLFTDTKAELAIFFIVHDLLWDTHGSHNLLLDSWDARTSLVCLVCVCVCNFFHYSCLTLRFSWITQSPPYFLECEY